MTMLYPFSTHLSQLPLPVVKWLKRCLDNREETQVVITRKGTLQTESKTFEKVRICI
jgi:hypothetical protein